MFRLKFLAAFFIIWSISVFSYAQEAASEEKSGKVNLGKIVISASKIEQFYREVPNNISVVTSQDIESGPVNEFTEAIDTLPAVNVIDYGSLGSARTVQVRGTSNTQVLTLVDGRPLNTPRDGATDFNQISLSNIERIEVLRGPAANIYGTSAIGGVINIITKKATGKMRTELLAKQGSFATKMESFTNSWKIKDFNYFVSYDYVGSHGHRENADYLSHNANLKLGYEFNKNNRFSFSSGYFKSKVGNPGPVTNQDLNDRSDSYKNFFDFTYNGKFLEDKGDILIKLYNNRDRLEFLETPYPVQKNTHQTKVYGFDSQFSYKFSDFLRTIFGLDYQDNKLNSSTSGKHDYNLKGAYSEIEIDLFNKLNCKIGGRWDGYSNFGDTFNPSASFSFWILDKIKIHGLAAKSFRAPTFNDLYWPRTNTSSGNPDLGPEKAFSFEGGFSTYFLDNLDTDVTFFKTRFRDLIAWVSNNNFWTPSNIGSAFTKGVEFEISYAFNDKLKTNWNYTYLEAENTQTHRDLTYRPKHLIKVAMSYLPIPELEINTNCLYKARVFADSANITTVGAYFVMNLNFSYKLNKFTRVLFEAKNIFDRSYQEVKDYSMPGRSFYGGVKLNF